ncbi:MAG: STAS/SEC14 domain-containing protein [Rhizomicrobium sp.]
MMEILSSDSKDVFSAIWHDPISSGDVRAGMTSAERDRLAGRHDVRLLAKVLHGEKPTSAAEILEASTFGFGQWRDFGRIAIITDEGWMRHAVQFFAPFFHGPVRVFSNTQAAEARLWINRHDLW